MRNLVAVFVKYPFYANLIIFVFFLAGIFGIFQMKKSFFPERTPKMITVQVAYPGASPKEMEEGVTMRVEEAIRGIVGIKEVTSTSSENFSVVRIETTGQYDLDESLMDVKNAVDGISSFPVDAEKPVVFKERNKTQAMFMGLVGENGTDLLELKKLADEIEFDLLTSGPVSQVNISGYPPLEISVEINEEDLLRYNLTISELTNVIRVNNQDISGGQIKSDTEEILIRTRNRSVNPQDIGDIVLRTNTDGSMLRLRDVATVDLQFFDNSQSSFMNGNRSISFNIQKLPEEDLEEISAYLNEYAERFNARHSNARLEITFDFLSVLQQRLNLLYENGGIGLALVLLSLGLFLNFRLSFWVAFGIPASFLGMFMIAHIYDITINMISLFGMLLVIGILVDDGIVIAENIYSHFEKGKSPKLAALDGTMEVLPAVMTSVTTTIIAFSPSFFVTGRLEFMYEMAFVVVFALFFSLFEALFVLPGHLSNSFVLRREKKKNFGTKIRNQLDGFLMFMRDRIYGRLLKKIIRWRWFVAVVPAALLLITVGLVSGGFIKLTFFPSIPFDQFNVDLAFKPGTGEKITLTELQRMEDAVWEVNSDLQEEYNDTVNFIQYTFVSTGNAFNGQETGPHAGNIFIILDNMEERAFSSYDIVNRVREKIGPVPAAEKFTVEGRNTFGDPVSISLLGENMEQLENATNDLVERLNKLDVLNNIRDNNALGKREIRLNLKPKAYFLGLDYGSISRQVRQGFFGDQAQRLQKGKDELRVWVRYPESGRVNVGQLEDMKIKTAMGEFPLSELASYEVTRGPVNIKHFNNRREIRVIAGVKDPTEPVPPILEEVEKNIMPEILGRYPSVDYKFQGQAKEGAESNQELVQYFSVAFVVILLILMLHFKSAGAAIIILLMIPLAWLGAVWGHGVEAKPVSMLSLWGMIALSGIIINDAVVFLQKYNTNLREGMKVFEAVFSAGKARFRPIALTTITTSVGLYPIILESSFQAQFLKPMAITLAYGVLVGTAFILMFFPVLILLKNDMNMAIAYGMRRYKLWLKMGERNIQLTEQQRKHLSERPSRESLEKAIIHQNRKIE